MSFTVLLLPPALLDPLPILSRENTRSRGFHYRPSTPDPSGSSRRSLVSHRGRADRVPGSAHPSPGASAAPHARVQLSSDPLTAPDPARPAPLPWRPGARPPGRPHWPGPPEPGSGVPGGALRPAQLAAPARMRSACPSASPSSPAGRRDSGRHRKVFKSPSRGPPSAPGAVEYRREARPRPAPGPPEVRAGPRPHRRPPGCSRRMACGGRLRGGWRRPSLLPSPSARPPASAAQVGTCWAGGGGSGARPGSCPAGFRGRRSAPRARSASIRGGAPDPARPWIRRCVPARPADAALATFNHTRESRGIPSSAVFHLKVTDTQAHTGRVNCKA